MRIATFNVNSVRARLPRLLPWLTTRSPDIVCLQEIKCRDEQFPREAIEDCGYNVEVFGQRTYNGVAILAKERVDDVVRGLPDEEEEAEARVISCTIDDVLLVNAYVVNGKEPGSEKYAYKLEWLERFRAYLEGSFDMSEKVVVTGDFNITFDDRDVHDPDAWRDKIHCSTPERDALASIMSLGMHDAFRKFEKSAGHYTWWDFRTRAWPRDAGLRIDHFLMSTPALDCCRAVEIDRAEREGEKPSDHAPVIATLD